MRRASIGLVCAVALLASSACDSGGQKPTAIQTGQTAAVSTRTPQVTPTPVRTGNGSVCDRVRPTLAGNWKSEERPPDGYPLSDVCWLTNAADPANQFQISVAVLPVSAQDVAVVRHQEDLKLKSGYVVKAVAGGIGPDSWSVAPAAVGPWVVFHSGGRLIKVAQHASGKGELAKVNAVARTIAALPGGIPPATRIGRRPECDRGTAVAIRLLGTKTIARRDSFDEGHVTCRWGGPHTVVVTEGGGLGSDPGLSFGYMKDAAAKGLAEMHRVTIGKEGLQQNGGSFLVCQISETLFITASIQPNSASQSTRVLALAKAIIPTYTG